jgi:hypothetical protein
MRKYPKTDTVMTIPNPAVATYVHEENVEHEWRNAKQRYLKLKAVTGKYGAWHVRKREQQRQAERRGAERQDRDDACEACARVAELLRSVAVSA